jgi:hypothetical protein
VEVDLLDVGRGGGVYPQGQRGTLTGPLSALLGEPLAAGGKRVQVAAWLLLLETLLAGLTLVVDSNEAHSAINASATDLSNPSTPAFALINGPLFILPVLMLLVLAAMAVGVRPRGGRWLTIPAQLAALLVLVISLRGILEVIAALAMTAVGIYAELLLFKRPGEAAAG